MGRASALLGRARRRDAATGALLALLLAYYAFHRSLPNLPTGWDVAFVGGVLIPAVFALVWLALPLRRARGFLPIAVAFAALAVVTTAAGLDVPSNFAKLAAAAAAAFWFVRLFESALIVAFIACLIPFVDAYSVWRGPTRHIISERPQVFSALSFAFPLAGERQAFLLWREPLADLAVTYEVRRRPGGVRNDEPLRDRDGDGDVGFLEAELDAGRDYHYDVVALHRGARETASIVARADDVNDGFTPGRPTQSSLAPADLRVESVDSAAKLGLPDLFFFTLFLVVADRFILRRRATWALMTASFSLTLAAAYALPVDGLPALPLLALAFLVANADLLARRVRLWRRLRRRRP